jgi:magnesium transporter
VSTVRSRAYRHGHLVGDGLTVDELRSQAAEPGTVVWIDLCNGSSGELRTLADHFGLHELAVEDAVRAHQRPKLDRYADHLFLSCRAARLDAEDTALVEAEVNIFIGDRWLISVRPDDTLDIDEVIGRWDRSPELAESGVTFLLYGILDVVVDTYFAAVDEVDSYFDEISEGIFSDEPIAPEDQQRWFQMRRSLFRLHRIAMPMREMVSSLMRRDHDLVTPEMYPYYQDVYDHTLRITEATDSLRDLVGTIVETNLSLRDYRQNQVMKKVTSWAAIIAVPTLITGFYGMNVPYPGFETRTGVWVSIVLMAAISMSLYRVFKRKEWL